jgi:uncharacterized membrane protein YdbT with pleckstrin-like domain
MSYVQEVLQPGETIRFRTNVDWFVYLKAIMALVIALALLVWHYMDAGADVLPLYGAAAFGISAVLLATPAWLKHLGTEIAVTDWCIVSKSGLVQRHTTEANMDKVESVDADQSMFGQLFGYESVTIRGTGEGDRDAARHRSGA